MESSPGAAPRRLRNVAFVLFLLALSALIFAAFCKYSGVGINPDATISGMLEGSARMPFVQRVLVPLVARLISPAIPHAAVEFLDGAASAAMGETWNTFFRDRLGGDRFPREVIAVLLTMFVALAGFSIAAWRFALQLGNTPRTSAVVATLLLIACGALTSRFGYVYDYAQAFLFCTALLLMYRQQWFAYLCVCMLGALNKETFLFICPVFAIYFLRRLPLRQFILLSLAQAVVFGVVRLILLTVFRGNDGVLAQWHFLDQVDYIRSMAQHEPLKLIILLTTLATIAALVTYRWREKSPFLKAGMIIVPAFVVMFVLWGYPSEYRVYLEVLPIIGLLMVPPARRATRENS
jgi:hypothetical protein